MTVIQGEQNGADIHAPDFWRASRVKQRNLLIQMSKYFPDHNRLFLLIVGIFVCATVFSPIQAQEQPLSLFKDLVGKQWKGHYVNSNDSVIEHFIRWEYALDSKYVKQTKEVPELNFKMETFFFWDFELKQYVLADADQQGYDC